MEGAPGRKAKQSAGVTMMATASDASSETMYANANGVSSLPSTPDKPKIGRNTSTMITVAKTIDVRISSVASRTTSLAGRRSSSRLA